MPNSHGVQSISIPLTNSSNLQALESINMLTASIAEYGREGNI